MVQQLMKWIGTLHVSTKEEGLQFMQRVVDCQRVEAAAMQLEVCPTTNRLHVQCFIQLIKGAKASLQTMKTILQTETIHLEGAKDAEASWEYCTKEETRLEGTEPVIKGTCPGGQGARQGDREYERIFKLHLRMIGILPCDGGRLGLTQIGF